MSQKELILAIKTLGQIAEPLLEFTTTQKEVAMNPLLEQMAAQFSAGILDASMEESQSLLELLDHPTIRENLDLLIEFGKACLDLFVNPAGIDFFIQLLNFYATISQDLLELINLFTHILEVQQS